MTHMNTKDGKIKWLTDQGYSPAMLREMSDEQLDKVYREVEEWNNNNTWN